MTINIVFIESSRGKSGASQYIMRDISKPRKRGNDKVTEEVEFEKSKS